MRTPCLSPLVLSLAVAACSDTTETLAIGELFTVEGPGSLAPPGRGPDDRLILATRDAPGRISTFDLGTGAALEGPFDAFPTSFAPTAVDRRLALVTPVGRIALYELNGTPAALVPSTPLGPTGPLVAGPGATLLVATTSGRLLAFDANGNLRFDALLDGAATGAPAVTASGVSFVGTDTGRLYGFEPDGTERFVVELTPPVTAPVLLRSSEVAISTGSGIRLFDQAGRPTLTGDRVGSAGLVAAPAGGWVAWTSDGRLDRFDGAGAFRYSVQLGVAASVAPVPLPEDRWAWVTDEGVARTIGDDGSILAERPLDGRPAGALLPGSGSRVYVPIGDQVLALDFAVVL